MAGYGRTEEFMSINVHEHEDHERAFFDSADWALCKQGAGINEKSTIAIETLRPKLERTPRQCLPPRRPTCISGGDHHVSFVASYDNDLLQSKDVQSTQKNVGTC
ncbi:cAMP-regulated phosphoprotein 19-related protein isoform 1 [Tanacetum coccineum]